MACTTQFVIYQASQRSHYLAPPLGILTPQEPNPPGKRTWLQRYKNYFDFCNTSRKNSFTLNATEACFAEARSPLPSFAFAKVTLLFYSSQIYFHNPCVKKGCSTIPQQLTEENFLPRSGCRAAFEGFYFFTKRTATILAVAVFTSPAHSSISKTALRSVTSRGRATTFRAQFIGVGRR